MLYAQVRRLIQTAIDKADEAATALSDESGKPLEEPNTGRKLAARSALWHAREALSKASRLIEGKEKPDQDAEAVPGAAAGGLSKLEES